MGTLEKNIKLQLCRGIALLPVLAVLVGCEASQQSGRFVVSGSFKLKTNTVATLKSEARSRREPWIESLSDW